MANNSASSVLLQIMSHCDKCEKECPMHNCIFLKNLELDGEVDDYNKDLLESIGLDENDIPLFQVTRIVERKGIETALELIDRLDDKHVKLVITGSAADDDRKGYYRELINIINDRKLENRVVFAHHRILNNRDLTPDKKKVYSLSDAYAHATASTYFSTYEGLGNAFV